MIISMPEVLRPNTVTITRYTYTSSAHGGEVRTVASTTTGLKCSVQPYTPREPRTTDQERVGELVTHRVFFVNDPNVSADDEITWGTRTLAVVNSYDASAGNGSAYVVECQERQ